MQALMNAPKSMSVPGTTRPEMVSAPPPAITEMSGLIMFVVSAGNDGRECAADDDRNGQIHHVAAVDELLEFAEELLHGASFAFFLSFFLCLRAHL